MKAPKVLVVTPDFPPAQGGIQRLMHQLVINWNRVDTRVLTFDSQGADAFDRGQPLSLRRVRTRRLTHRGAVGVLNLVALAEARHFRPDVVLSAHVVTSPAGWAIGRLLSRPCVQYLYAQEFAERPRLCRFAMHHAAALIAISRHTEHLARAGGADPRRLRRIPPGVELPAESRRRGEGRPIVVTVSRIRETYKGHDIMIEALPRIRHRVPEVLWVVIGEGPLRREYEAIVRSRGLERHVQFLGPLDDRQRDAWLDRARVLAMPSRLPRTGGGEGFGIAYLEAGAHGIPVVAGAVGGALDAVVPGVTGLLVDPNDSSAVADAISDLLLDPDRAERMGRAAQARARQYAWPSIAEKVEEVLLEVAAGR